MRRGTKVGQAYVAITADGAGIDKDIADAVDSAGPGVEKAGDEHGERYGDEFGEALKDKLEPLMEKLGNTLSRRLSRRVGDGMNKMVNDDSARSIGTRLGDKIGDAVTDRLESSFAALADDLEDRLKVSGNGGRGGTTRPPTASGASDSGDGRSGADILGGLFGRGSRNNFLHVLGSMVRTASKLVSGLTGVVTNMGKNFVAGFKGAAEGASFFRKILAGVGATSSGLFASLAKSGPAALAALALAIVVVIPLASALVSVMGALLAIVIALSATIASALVAALAVGAGAMGAMAVAGGLLTAAFMSMTDAQKKLLSDAFRPLKAEMVGIGQLMLRDMIPAFSTWSSNLQVALGLVAPLAQVMGKAFADAGTSLTAALSGPGFARLSVALGTYLPGIVRTLARALGGFLNGMAGLFAGLLPYVDRFARYLEGVASRFSKWANSAQGQNAIADFMDRAVESAKSLWGFLKELGGLISDLLFNKDAQGAGNNIFDSMADGIRALRKHIKNGDIKKWFEDAEEFAKKLGKAFKGIGRVLESLYNSGVLDLVGDAIVFMADSFENLADILEPVTDFLGNDLVQEILGLLNPITSVGTAIGGLIDKFKELFGLGSDPFLSASGIFDDAWATGEDGAVVGPVYDPAYAAQLAAQQAADAIGNLTNIGTNALNQTSAANGGWMQEWKNPYVKWANSLISDGPGIAAQIREAIRSVNKEIGAALRSIGHLFSKEEAHSTIQSLTQSINDTAKSLVDAARQSLNSAASNLASASSPAEAQRALRAVHGAQAALRDAIRQQKVLNRLSDTLRKQGKSSERRIDRLVKGLDAENATLADYAAARGRIAARLQRANQQLAEAIQLRASYRSQVTDAIKAFGALTTAQAKTVDGVEQALTAADITTNLQDRLDKIKSFQNNLRLLLAQGLSNAAYQQIVDAGVDGGSQFAQALLDGGLSAIQGTNDLVGQINGIANQLGIDASNRLYQAGVDAARGLVDGLTSLSAQLDAAATRLGNSIARAVKRALGIKSPSRVMLAAMDEVGDGIAGGLDRQGGKVGSAASRLSDKIAVSPEVASYAARRRDTEEVSGNGTGQKFRDLVVVTPTEDPHAVAMETLNEVTGRL